MTRPLAAAARASLVGASLAALLAAGPCLAWGPFGHAKPQAKAASQTGQAATYEAAIRQALDERRFVDAADMLAKAKVEGVTSPTMSVLHGDLYLQRNDFGDALNEFQSAENDPVARAAALEGEGLALSMTGKSDEALADLKQATALDKTLWRAWDGLGREYDMHKAWKLSAAAYATALACPGVNTAIVLNNRGYSHLLQQQTTDASADFVAALAKDPTLAAARTNLRITMAMEGEYQSATMTGAGDNRAAVLNNVGLAAAIHGDYPEAEKLLTEAIAAKGQFYARATDNLRLAKELQSRAQEIHPITAVSR